MSEIGRMEAEKFTPKETIESLRVQHERSSVSISTLILLC